MWQSMGHTPIAIAGSDQQRLNHILVTLNFTWKSIEFEGKQYLKGPSADKSITIVALPEDVVCRGLCHSYKLSSYYVCHPRTTHNSELKNQKLLHRGLWKINDRWNKTLDTVQSISEWIQDNYN